MNNFDDDEVRESAKFVVPEEDQPKKKEAEKAAVPKTDPVLGEGNRKMGIREFFSNSSEAKQIGGKYCIHAFNHYLSQADRMAERKTYKQWLAEFTAFVNQRN